MIFLASDVLHQLVNDGMDAFSRQAFVVLTESVEGWLEVVSHIVQNTATLWRTGPSLLVTVVWDLELVEEMLRKLTGARVCVFTKHQNVRNLIFQ